MSDKRLSPRARGCLWLVTIPTVSVARIEANAANGTLPNIVLLMADDQGWGDVGFRPGAIARTPNIDDMAQHGLRLENFHAAAPVCTPLAAAS